MTTTKPIPDALPIPEAFRVAHYHQDDLMQMLGVTQEQFWDDLLSGLVPAGVPLLAAIGAPMLVWPREDIDQWIAAGFPEQTALASRCRRVYAALERSIQDEYGQPLESIRETLLTRN